MMPAQGGEQWLVTVEDASHGTLVTDYLNRRRAQIAGLRTALESGDFEALWMAGHRMHGAGGSYGVPRISELGAVLEFAAFEREVPKIAEALDQLQTYLDRVAIVTGGT